MKGRKLFLEWAVDTPLPRRGTGYHFNFARARHCCGPNRHRCASGQRDHRSRRSRPPAGPRAAAPLRPPE
ncbi:hypothetical protein [Synechococcus sp. MW101C3]|uniref:hypothetical protein n=1 Tax=Synechococcus sp. MW101C3 TaxID=210768 RepID=UPI001E5C689A|nr:hypothetical protein [Synechococcus sp. MW101C3]